MDVELGKLHLGEITYLTRPRSDCFYDLWIDFYIEKPVDYGTYYGSHEILMDNEAFQQFCGTYAYVDFEPESNYLEQQSFESVTEHLIDGDYHEHTWHNIYATGRVDFMVNLSRGYTDFIPWLRDYFKDHFEVDKTIPMVRLVSCEII